ncbi:nitrate reductase [Duganella aceris]|uniref:Molybdopterin-dependent oxidoreductase n=1 Tax=Duganella aceris TaxID=2703883 RepID=A0ABX0FQX1_9BURK|nr:nitrate reductase [Duganella aceris]NGZ86837.1 molybdopterin-dependent oxidoreductase [Duganella aceris]
MNLSTDHLAVRTTCAYCGVGCGVQATPLADGVIAIAGDKLHPANKGRLCVKGSALGETVGLDGRLLYPQLRDAGGLRRVSWDEALDKVADGWRAIIDEHGPDAVALYVSGQLLTEDYYVANKLMKGYIGSANIDTNSRLCMSSAVAGYKRAFGEDLVPLCYDDLELADMVVLVGSNTAWCHPILFQRILKAKEARPEMKLVVIDPRRTATCELADLHLPVKAGTDVWLFNGLLSYLARIGAVDPRFIAQHTNGFDAALATANVDCSDPAAVAKICRIELAVLMEFYEAFAATRKTITAYSMGVNQSSAGTDKVNAIINCHLIGGRIGKPGMGPFSITGQPNAMGGREVGGLANMLAAHMDLERADHRDVVQTFWDSPAIADKPGLKAVDLFKAIEDGKVKAVWVIATNPIVSLPDADQARRALEKCDLVVASDIMQNTDTNAYADVLLPALGWGEKDGTVTNSERRISRQRAFLAAPGEALPDWKIISLFAQRMGYGGFDFGGAGEVFDEHARLSGFRNAHGDVPRAFDMSGLGGLDNREYDDLEPIQWPVRRTAAGELQVEARLFKDHVFAHADGKARFIATAPRAPMHAVSEEYPLSLNTGRVRDQWHTMTRTGKSATLADHIAESFVDMHPQDALLHGVREGELARVSSAWGAMVARVQHGGGIPRGSIFVPIHWSGQTSSDARVGALVNPVVDPVSGEPEFKHTPVRIEQFRVNWHGFILSRDELDLDSVAHWTRVQGRQFARYELAGRNTIDDFSGWARGLLAVRDPEADWLEYEDRSAGVYRAVHVVNDRIEQCLFLSPRQDMPPRAWLASLFVKDQLSEIDRVGLLVGMPVEKGADTGPTVCSCFGVGRNTICQAIVEKDLKTVPEVTACLKAGGNCGSCVPEIKKILVQTRAEAEEARL